MWSVRLTFGKKYSNGKRKKIERMMIALVMIAAICERAPVKPFSRDPGCQDTDTIYKSEGRTRD